MNFFDYFQVAGIIVALCFIVGKAIYLRAVRGINPIVIGRSKGVWRVVEIFCLAALFSWMAEVCLHAAHSSFDIFKQLSDRPIVTALPFKVVGVVLVATGIAIFAMAFFHFGESWRVGIDRESPGTLVTTGIFSVTRNPIYLALDFWFIGTFLINGMWFFLIFALLALVAIHFQILREEAFLRNQYGQSYAEYCQRTARYLIW